MLAVPKAIIDVLGWGANIELGLAIQGGRLMAGLPFQMIAAAEELPTSAPKPAGISRLVCPKCQNAVKPWGPEHVRCDKCAENFSRLV